jgi:hypothetical protein
MRQNLTANNHAKQLGEAHNKQSDRHSFTRVSTEVWLTVGHSPVRVRGVLLGAYERATKDLQFWLNHNLL